jgi:hypothetical protein
VFQDELGFDSLKIKYKLISHKNRIYEEERLQARLNPKANKIRPKKCRRKKYKI